MASAVERRRFTGVVLAVIVLDLVTKFAAEAWLPRWLGVPILGEFFQLKLVYNPGAAFGIHVGAHSRWFFMALSVVALFVLAAMRRETREGDRLRLHALALVFAGALGNLLDRIRSPRGVVDFLDFTFGAYHFPTFNLADAAISCGAVLLALSLWNEGRVAQPAPSPSPPPPPAQA